MAAAGFDAANSVYCVYIDILEKPANRGSIAKKINDHMYANKCEAYDLENVLEKIYVSKDYIKLWKAPTSFSLNDFEAFVNNPNSKLGSVKVRIRMLIVNHQYDKTFTVTSTS